jgi:hypothetical protein
MLTKSRQSLTKSSGGTEDLVIGWLRTNSDTHRDHGGGVAETLLQLGLVVWPSKPPADSFARFGPQNPRWSSRQHMTLSEVHVKAKLSREGLVAVRCTVLYLDHFAPRVK